MATSPPASITIDSAFGKLHAVLQPAAELDADHDEGWTVSSRPLIVLLHGEGRSVSWKAWEPALAPLGMLGYTCAALDMPGYGDSKGNREEGKARIDEVIQAVCKGTGKDVCVVVGRAEGGRGALNAAAQAKRNAVAAIVVCHPVAPAEATLKSVVMQRCPALVTWARDEKGGQLFTAPHGAAYFVRHLGCDLVPWDCAGDYGGDETRFYNTDFCNHVHSFLLSRLARRLRRRRTARAGVRATPAAPCTPASTSADVSTAAPVTSTVPTPLSRSVSDRLFGMKATEEREEAVVLEESDDEIAVGAESDAAMKVAIRCEVVVAAPAFEGMATQKDRSSTDWEAECVAIFRRFDANGDGRIDLTEWTRVLQILDPGKYNNDRAAKMFKMLDISDTSSISYEELLRWIFLEEEDNQAVLGLLRKAPGQGLTLPSVGEVASKATAAEAADDAGEGCGAAMKTVPSAEAATAAPDDAGDGCSAAVKADVAEDALVEEEDGGESASELRIAASEAEDWRYELQERWVDCGGHRMHLLTQGPPDASVVLLLLHGDGPRSSNEHWRPALGPLSEREVYTIAASMPGYGLSPGSRSVFRSATDAVDLILAMSRELRLQGRLVIGGRSVGGKVALQVAARDPRAVRGLLLTHPVSPGPATLAQVNAPCLLTWAKDDAGGPGHPGNHPYFGPNGAAFMVQKVHCELYSWEERAILRQAGLDVKRDFLNRTDAHFAAEAVFYSEYYPVRVVSWLHARRLLRR